LLEGLHVIDASIKVAHGRDRVSLIETRHAIASAKTMAEQVKLILDPLLAELIARWRSARGLASFPRNSLSGSIANGGRFGAWYEDLSALARALSSGAARPLLRLRRASPEIAAMGFDVLYLATHPSDWPQPSQGAQQLGGMPARRSGPHRWAIGADEGGHDSIHPELGTLADFDSFRGDGARLGLEIALDFAVQCSPDHPGWGGTRTGSASGRTEPSSTPENPPKKYQTSSPSISTRRIVRGLYQACSMSVLFWVKRGFVSFASTTRIPNR